MARWFTSDLHIGHANISRFCGRPFLEEGYVDGEATLVPDIHRMNVTICQAINNLVSAEDELWVLGDAVMGHFDRTVHIRRHLTAGRVILVPGNHDKCHPMHKKHDEFRQRYEEAGWEVAEPTLELVLSDGTGVQVSHFPYSLSPQESRARQGATTATDRFAAWRPADDGRWLLCGHVHDAWRQRDRQINVGIDAWGGRPLSESEVVALIAQGPESRDRLPWLPREAPTA